MSRWQLSLRIAFRVALLFTLVMALLPQPPAMPGEPPDKVLHILAFLVLTGLALVAYPGMPWLRLAILMSALGALIELLQMIPALNRDAQWLDWVADTGAVLFVLAVATVLRRWRVR